MRSFIALVFCLFASQAFASSFNCSYSADRNLSIDPAGLRALAIDLNASDLHVRGEAGLTKIEVHGKACASQESRLAELTVEQSRSGDRVTLTPHQASEQTFGVFGSNYAYIDLDVRVPANLPIEVKSASGDADIESIAALDFSSSSGDLTLRHITGSAVVEVHSGDVNADDIGTLEVRHSGSGDISARNVHGEVKVGGVGSGDLRFHGVAKGVHVESVGSGDVTVEHAGGDVVVGSIGSGDIRVADVSGDFRVHAAGSGDIHHRDVKGKVEIPQRDD